MPSSHRSILALLLPALLLASLSCRDPSKRRNTPISATYTPSTAVASGMVTIPYVLRHRQTNGVAIQPMFSTDGGYSFGFATGGPGGDGVVNLTASSSGIEHRFVWDSVADIGYTARVVVFEIVAYGGRAGTSLSSAPFLVVNATQLATGLATARGGHSATLLPDGRVLIAGGRDANGQPLSTTELFDPATGNLAAGAALARARSGHVALRLADGRVLVAGGRDGRGDSMAGTELYTPAAGAAGAFAAGADLTTARQDAAAARLNDGRVLVTGGLGLGQFTAYASTELYAPAPGAAGAFAAGPALNVARRRHTATVLADGRVFIAGGGRGLDSAEVFDAAATQSTAIAATLRGGRGGHSAVLLSDGRVFLAGGEGPAGERADIEFFDPAASAFARLLPIAPSHQNAAMVMLADGRLLLLGGSSAGQPQAVINAYRPLD